MTIETVIAQVQRKARKYYKCIIKIGDKTFEGCDLYITDLSSQFNIGDIIEMKTEIQRITSHWKYPAHYYYNALEIISINDKSRVN